MKRDQLLGPVSENAFHMTAANMVHGKNFPAVGDFEKPLKNRTREIFKNVPTDRGRLGPPTRIQYAIACEIHPDVRKICRT